MCSSISSSLVTLFSARRKHAQHICDYQVQPLAREQDIAEVHTVTRTPFDTMARRLGFVLYKLIHCMVCAQTHEDARPAPSAVRMEGRDVTRHLYTHSVKRQHMASPLDMVSSCDPNFFIICCFEINSRNVS